MITPKNNTPSSGTRIRWTPQERDELIDKGAKLLIERPRWKPIEIVRHAMYALPADRRREVISLQAFQKDYDQMVQRSEKMKSVERAAEARVSDNELPLAKDTKDKGVTQQDIAAALAMPTGTNLYAQVATLFAKEVAQHLKDTVTEIAQEIQPTEKNAVREVLLDISARVAKLELLMGAFARELGVTVSEEVGSQEQNNIDSAKNEAAQSEADRASLPQADTTASAIPGRTKMGSILVIGPRGRQIESIKKDFSGQPVKLNFAQAGSSKSLHSDAGHVVVMKKFVGHRDTNANPHATVVEGGISQVKEAIRSVIDRLSHR